MPGAAEQQQIPCPPAGEFQRRPLVLSKFKHVRHKSKSYFHY